MIRALLIAPDTLRWFLAYVPVTRRGKILPRSETKRPNKSTSTETHNTEIIFLY